MGRQTIPNKIVIFCILLIFAFAASAATSDCNQLLRKLEDYNWGVSFYGKEHQKTLTIFHQCASTNHINTKYREFYHSKLLMLTGNIDKAVTHLLEQSINGNDESQNLLGDIYNNKKFRKYYDPEKAKKWYEQAMSAGNIRAMVSLGNLLLQKKNQTDRNKGVTYLVEAANNGDATAQTILGHIFYTGKYIKRDVNKSIKWLLKAAEKPNFDALFMLFSIFTVERGYPKEKQRYIEIVDEKSKSNPIYLIMLSIFYDVGFGRKQDKQLSKQYMQEGISMLSSNDKFYFKQALQRSGIIYALRYQVAN